MPPLHITNSMRDGRYSRPWGSKNRSRLRLCAVFSHPHPSPPQTCGLLYKVGWNVAYLERYAKCPLKLLKNIDKRK